MHTFYKYGFFVLLATCLGLLSLLYISPHATTPIYKPEIENTPTRQTESATDPSDTAKPTFELFAPFKQLVHYQVISKISQLASTGGVKIKLPILESNGKRLSKSIPILFDLSPSETASINAAIERANELLTIERKKHATTQFLDDGTLQIDIASFPERGSEIYSELRSDFKKVLGQSNYALFTQLTESSIEDNFDYFGAEICSFNIRRVEDVEKTGHPIFSTTYVENRGEFKSTSSSRIIGAEYFEIGAIPVHRLVPTEELMNLPITKEP